MRTRIGNYAYDVREEPYAEQDGLAHWTFIVYRVRPTQELLVYGEISPNREHAEHNARQAIELYIELDRITSEEPKAPDGTSAQTSSSVANMEVYDRGELGKECVNPNHLGTGEDCTLAVKGQRREIPEPPKTDVMLRLTGLDWEFLKGLKIGRE